MQPIDLEGETVVRIALQPIGDQQHDRALGEHAPRPKLVESAQRGGDARAAGPVGDARCDRGEPLVRILALSARVTLVSRVPNKKVCTRLRASVTAWRKCRNSRVYWLMEPEISSSATSGGALTRGPRYFRSITAPPALRLARKVRRMSIHDHGDAAQGGVSSPHQARAQAA